MIFKSLVVASLLLAGPAAAASVTIETYRGPAEVSQSPSKVAVFDIAALDTITALGVKPVGVVQPLYVDYLKEQVAGAEAVGSLFEPDYETVAALQPDLIIAGGRSSKVVPQLKKLAPALDMTIGENAVTDGRARLAAYAKIFNKEAEAKALAEQLDTKLKTAQNAISGKGKALIIMTNGPKVTAYGTEGRFGWLHTALKLPEAVEQVEKATHGEAVSFEFINKANPDIIFVIDRLVAIGRDGTSAATTLDNALVHETNAWKNEQVIYLNAANLYIAGGGIQSMLATLDEITVAFSGS